MSTSIDKNMGKADLLGAAADCLRRANEVEDDAAVTWHLACFERLPGEEPRFTLYGFGNAPDVPSEDL